MTTRSTTPLERRAVRQLLLERKCRQMAVLLLADQGVQDPTKHPEFEALVQTLIAGLDRFREAAARAAKGRHVAECPVGPCALEKGHEGPHDSVPPPR